MSNDVQRDAAREPAAAWRRLRRFTLYTLFLAGIPVLLLVGAELALRVAGYGDSTRFFVKEHRDGELFYAVNRHFYQQFLSYPVGSIMDLDDLGFRVPATKVPGTYRVFIFGGSAAHGCTPDFAYGFGRILEVMLDAQFPDVNIEVYNAACPAMNSHVMRAAAQACAHLQPDVFVVYMGNNEFSGPFGPAWSGERGPRYTAIRFHCLLSNLRLLQLLSVRGREAWLPRKEEARSYLETLHRYRPDAQQRARMYEHFERNLGAVCEAGTSAGATVLVCTLACNLRDWAPFDSKHRPDIASSDRLEWEQRYKQGMKYEEAGEVMQAVEAYELAAGFDDTYAALAFRLGNCYRELGQYDEAEAWLIRARDFDCLPLRADTRMNDIIVKTAARGESAGVRLVDVAGHLARHSAHGIPDRRFFWDFAHLNFAGNYQVACALYRPVVQGLQRRAAAAVQAEAVPIPEQECARRLALTPYVLLAHAKALLPAFHFWGVSQGNVIWLEEQIAALEKECGPEGIARAVGAYREAMGLRPQDYYLPLRYVHMLIELGEVDLALGEGRKLVTRFPARRGSRLALASALEKVGRRAEAASELRNLLELYPDDDEAQRRLETLSE